MNDILDKISNLNMTFAMQIYIMMGVMLLLIAVCMILILVIAVKYKRLRKFVESGEPIDPVASEVESSDFFEEGPVETSADQEKLSEIAKKVAEIDIKQQKYFDKIKVLRYNQNSVDGKVHESFSIGLTNGEKNGIVLTGVETDSGATLLTVKSIKDGKSNIELTEAEKVAVLRKGEKTC